MESDKKASVLKKKRAHFLIKAQFKRCNKCGSSNYVLNGYYKFKHPLYKCLGCGYAGYCFPLKEKKEKRARDVIFEYLYQISIYGEVMKSISYFCDFNDISRGTFYRWKRLYLKDARREMDNYIAELKSHDSPPVIRNLAIKPRHVSENENSKSRSGHVSESENSKNKKKRKKRKKKQFKNSNKKKKKKR